jgi:hypothetical protein
MWYYNFIKSNPFRSYLLRSKMGYRSKWYAPDHRRVSSLHPFDGGGAGSGLSSCNRGIAAANKSDHADKKSRRLGALGAGSGRVAKKQTGDLSAARLLH